MDMHKVTSSNIAAIGFDEGSSTLQVLFLNGAMYQYFDVAEELFIGMQSAESAGKYLNAHIKGNFRYSKV